MEDYPWEESFPKMIEFEATHSGWVCDVPQLPRTDVSKLIKKCMIAESLPASYLLSHALDQENLSKEDAIKTFRYVKSMYVNIDCCFSAVALSPKLPTKELIWMVEHFKENEDPYIHSLGNLAQRASHDTAAQEFLRNHASKITDENLKSWLAGACPWIDESP